MDKKKNGELDDTPRKRERLKERIGCEANIKMHWDSDIKKFFISEWVDKHNHVMVLGKYNHLHRSRRSINSTNSKLAKIHTFAGVPPRRSFDIMPQIAGGAAHVRFTMEDLRNHRQPPYLSLPKWEEDSMMQKQFNERAIGNKQFFYKMLEDENGEVLDVFWSNGRMRAEYSVFGDSINFDTTYGTNTDYRPLSEILVLLIMIMITFVTLVLLISFCIT